MTALSIVTRNCAHCDLLCAEYDDGDARIPRAVRAVMPRILQGAEICEPCDETQHRPGDVRTFNTSGGIETR